MCKLARTLTYIKKTLKEKMMVFECLPHRRELCTHLDRDIFFDFLCCNGQGLVLCNKQLEHAFPKGMVVSPLHYNGKSFKKQENPQAEMIKNPNVQLNKKSKACQ